MIQKECALIVPHQTSIFVVFKKMTRQINWSLKRQMVNDFTIF